MLKLAIFSVCVAMAVLGAPPQPGKPAEIVSYENNNDGLGNYSYAFKTSDGVERQEQAELKNAGSEQENYIVTGSFSYIGPDGVSYSVQYIADNNGFQPQGKHLPVGP